MSYATPPLGVSIGGEPACYIIEHHLSRFVEGQDPSNIELMWDQMYRSTLNYGRKGLPMWVTDLYVYVDILIPNPEFECIQNILHILDA